MTDRYDRQKRIRGWRQEWLTKARVLVAGAGALGNEAIRNFALMGVGRILAADMDVVETVNLNRCALFRTEDAGKPKAGTAARAAAALNPEIKVVPLEGDLYTDVGLGVFRYANLVVGGLDGLAVRDHVGRCCTLAGVPYLDGGMWAWGGEVRWFLPGGKPCVRCGLVGGQPPPASERRSCSGFRKDEPSEPPMPTSIAATAVVGGLLAQEAARFLFGAEVKSGDALVFNGLRGMMHRTALPDDPECGCPAPYREIVELEAAAERTTARDLLEIAAERWGGESRLWLGRDVVRFFPCQKCGFVQTDFRLRDRMAESAPRCPECGNPRDMEFFDQLSETDEAASRPLTELGVPPGEILTIQTEESLRFVELTEDVRAVWEDGPKEVR